MDPNKMAQLQATIKLRADDLKEELSDLAKWEKEIHKKDEAIRKKNVKVEHEFPPVRGTAPVGSWTKKNNDSDTSSNSNNKGGKNEKASQSTAATTTTAPKEDPITVCKLQGNEFFKLGKFEDALRLYTKGIDMDPESKTTHVLYGNRAMVYCKKEMWDLAERDATKCVGLNRTYSKGFYRRALARKAMGKLKDARTDLETVLALTPNDADTMRELQDVTAKLVQQQRQNEAVVNSQQKQGSGGVAVKKKIVIEEVSDDEDEDEEDAEDTSAKKREAEETKRRLEREEAEIKQRQEEERKERLEEEAKAVQRRAEEARKRKEEVERLERERAKKRKTNSRVEILSSSDDDEPEKEKRSAPPRPAAAAAAAAASSTAAPSAMNVNVQQISKDELLAQLRAIDSDEAEEAFSPSKAATTSTPAPIACTSTTEDDAADSQKIPSPSCTTTEAAAAPAEPQTTMSPTVSASASPSRGSSSATAAGSPHRIATTMYSVMGLRSRQHPKNFTEFELMYNHLKKYQAELVGTYIDSIDVSRWATLMGSSMTGDMLEDVLRVASGCLSVFVQAEGETETASVLSVDEAAALLLGVSKCKRLEEMVMFLDDTTLVDNALAYIASHPKARELKKAFAY